MPKGQILTLVGSIFLLAGSVFIGAGALRAAAIVSFLSSAERTEGTVVALKTGTDFDYGDRDIYWYPTVEFTVGGQRFSFESEIGNDPPAYREGETVPVAYDPADPFDARIVSFGWFILRPAAFGGFGVVFFAIGAVLLLKAWKVARERAWLKQNGREVWAEITDVDRERSVRLNGRHPYVVHATWYDARTGQRHAAASDYVRHDPAPSLQGRTHVRVFYDPGDPDRNLLDLSAAR